MKVFTVVFRCISLLVLLTMLEATDLHAANTVGNGGHGVTCTATSENKLAGIYALDYLVGYDQIDPTTEYYQGPEFPADHLAAVLMEKSPELGRSFRSFLRNA